VCREEEGSAATKVCVWPSLLGVAKIECYAVLIYNPVCFALPRNMFSSRTVRNTITGELFFFLLTLIKTYKVSGQTSVDLPNSLKLS